MLKTIQIVYEWQFGDFNSIITIQIIGRCLQCNRVAFDQLKIQINNFINKPLMQRVRIRSMLNQMKVVKSTALSMREQISFNDTLLGFSRSKMQQFRDKLQQEQMHNSFIIQSKELLKNQYDKIRHAASQKKSHELMRDSKLKTPKMSVKAFMMTTPLKVRITTQNLQQLGIQKKKINQRGFIQSGRKLKHYGHYNNFSNFSQDEYHFYDPHIDGSDRSYSNNKIALQDQISDKNAQKYKTLNLKGHWNELKRNKIKIGSAKKQRRNESFRPRRDSNCSITPWDIRASNKGIGE